MPTLAQIKLPVPRDWSELEDIVVSAINTQNPSVTPARYATQGQAQDGVDIFFEDSLTRAVGVQCKCVDSFTFSQFRAEVAKAETFKPPLENYIVAISLPRDAVLQKKVFQLSLERAKSGKFRVGAWFWPDISGDLSRDPAELARHYPEMFGGVVSTATPASEAPATALLTQRLAAYQELWNYLNNTLLPERTHPDYDWDYALDDMASALGNHHKRLRELHRRFGSILPKSVEESLVSAASQAQDGMFEIGMDDDSSVPHAARRSAESVYEHLTNAVEELRVELDRSRLRFLS